MMKSLVMLSLCFALSACSAADGKWPSLMTAKSPDPVVAATDPAFGAVPVIGAAQPSLPARSAASFALQPLSARLEQEQRGFIFAIERLTDQRTNVVTAQRAAQGQPTKSAAALAAKSAQRKIEGLAVDLADQQYVLLGIIADIAMGAPSSERDDLLILGGKQLIALDGALQREGIAPAQSPTAATAIAQKFEADKAKWQVQNAALQKSLSQVKVRGPQDAAWNAAQIDLTRMSQAAKLFSSSAQNLEIYLGKLVRDFAGGAVTIAEINLVGAQLRTIIAAEDDNFALLQNARGQLEQR